ncbi:MAG: exodeoxyribonuclease VII large subunit [Pseudomonadales bacterium]|nr:exodeoxyribonuclease VII large subunit [Pseudomonadales bacterium]
MADLPQSKPADSAESVLSVSSLNRLARSLLETNFPAVAVEGEISNLATPASGHWYLTLKDKNSQLRCAMFRNRNRLLKFRPSNGMQVVIRGRLSIYEGRGDYQLIAESMEEAGDGALRRAFEELKNKLQIEGLFDEDHKQEVGSEFQHIGIITSQTGAAIRDMLTVFRRRFPAIRITLLPVAVQGMEAPTEIVNAITLANTLRDKLGLEALIIGRGGGSLEDLQAFNEESVARAIFESELPVTSAVGHEIDFTIADFVADLRAPTPSAAAELMSPDQQDYLDYLAGYQQQLSSSIGNTIGEQRNNLGWLIKQLKRPDRRLMEHAQGLDRLEIQMRRAISNKVQQVDAEITQRKRALYARSPLHRLAETGRRLRAEFQRVTNGIETQLERSNSQLEQLARSLNAVSPLQVLARGYSITYSESGEVIQSTDQVNEKDRLRSRLATGSVTSVVTEVHSENDGKS